ncbi:MAG: flagellar hook-basal body complex protein FliE [Solirubrobacteraceae bacterium]
MVGPLGSSEWSVGSIAGSGPTNAGGAGATSFGGALSNALNSLEATQASATGAAQGLATGTIADPTQAIVQVENASLQMDLASQVRNKLVDASNTIFQTQV